MSATGTEQFTYRRGARPAAPPPPAADAAKLQIKGPRDLWQTLQIVKDGATKTTKTTRAMRVPGGVLVNTTTRGASFAAEALCFLPGCDVVRTTTGGAVVARAEERR